MSINPKDKITLLLGEDLITKVKHRAIDANYSVSQGCRVLLDAWQAGLIGYIPYQDKNKLPSISAVYIVSQDNKVVYVGQSSNIKMRFSTHSRKFEQDSLIFWFTINNKSDRWKVESLCIDIFEPEINSKQPPPEKQMILIRKPTTDIQVEAVSWLVGNHFEPEERLERIVIAYQLWQQQANQQYQRSLES